MESRAVRWLTLVVTSLTIGVLLGALLLRLPGWGGGLLALLLRPEGRPLALAAAVAALALLGAVARLAHAPGAVSLAWQLSLIPGAPQLGAWPAGIEDVGQE